MFKADGSGAFTEGAVPADMTAAVDAAREALIEMVAENDEKLMEHFFEAGTLTDEELASGLRSATIAGKLFPLVCTSALPNIGVPQLLDAIVACLPSPADRPFTGDGQGRRRRWRAPPTRRGRCSAFVWKTIADPFAGRITMFRVVSGVLKADSTVLQQDQGRAGAARPPDADAGQDARRTSRRSRPATWARSRS